MQVYSYEVEFEHGSATGEIQGESAKDAQARVKAMYQGNTYDAKDENGEPVVKSVVVTNVKVTEVK